MAAMRWLCLIFSACSMFYYLLLTRLLAEFTGNMMLWGAVASGVYLCALGCGVYWSEKVVPEKTVEVVTRIEASLSLMGPACIAALYIWHIVYRIYVYDFGHTEFDYLAASPQVLLGATAQIFPAVIGILSGLEFGLVNQIGMRQGISRVQRFIAIYHLGGLAATLVLLLVLVPFFEPLEIGLAVGIVNILAAVCWEWKIGHSTRGARARILAPSLGLGIIILACLRLDLVQLHHKCFYYNDYTWSTNSEGVVTHYFPYTFGEWVRKAKDYPRVERFPGVYQNIDFVKDGLSRTPLAKKSGGSEEWAMFMDSHFQISSTFEIDYHEAFAHVPTIMLNQIGKRVLVVGGGDGLLVRELLRYGDGIEEITLMDIDPQILRLARQLPRLTKLNQDVLSHPKVKVVAADAFHAVRRSNEIFDKIYVDTLFPFNFETSRLYSLEFFAALQKHLHPNGHMSILSPVELNDMADPSDKEILAILGSTLVRAGFQDVYLYGEKRHTFMLALPLKRKSPLFFDPNSRFIEFITNEDHLDEIQRVKLAANSKLVNSILRPTFFGQRDPNF